MLLFWGTLSPQNESDLAAVRFSASVAVGSIAIFPSGSLPFLEDGEAVASTEPAAFELEILFHAQAIARYPDDTKPKQSNALLTTSLAYTGGQREFPIDWDPRVVTRLMVVRGQYETLSIAVYGTVQSNNDVPPITKTIAAAHCLDDLPLSSPMDLTTTFDPTYLARQLLALIPRAPSLTTVLRLIMCIKPRKEDWDAPGFPFTEDLSAGIPTNLEALVEVLSKHVEASSAEYRLLSRATAKMFEERDIPSEQVATIASLLACQPPDLVEYVKDSLQPQRISLDDHTRPNLMGAAANPSLNPFLTACDFASAHPSGSDLINLRETIQGRALFDKALSSPRDQLGVVDYTTISHWLDFVILSERALGVWALSLLETNTMEDSESVTSLKVDGNNFIVEKQEDLLSYIRVVLGITAVFAVWGWSDSIRSGPTIERALGVLRTWQYVPGYNSFVNKLLSLPQFTVRLERLLQFDNSVPPSTRLLAEECLHALVTESPPSMLLKEDVSYTVLSLPRTMVGFDSGTREQLVQQAELADGGFDVALKFLTSPESRVLDTDHLLQTRMALSIVLQKLRKPNEGKREDPTTLVPSILKLMDLARCKLRGTEKELGEDTVALALEILLTIVAADSLKYIDTRPTARSLLRLASSTDRKSPRWRLICEAVELFSRCPSKCQAIKVRKILLAELLEEALDPRKSDNPVNLVNTSVDLLLRVLHTLPQDEVAESLPSSLELFARLWCILSTTQKIELAKAFDRLDINGALGLVGWIVAIELESMQDLFSAVDRSDCSEKFAVLIRFQLNHGFDFLDKLFCLENMEHGVTRLASKQFTTLIISTFERMSSHRIITRESTTLATTFTQSKDLDISLAALQFLLISAAEQLQYLPLAFQHLRSFTEDGRYGQTVPSQVMRWASQISQKPSDQVSSTSPGIGMLVNRLNTWRERQTSEKPNLQELFLGLERNFEDFRSFEKPKGMGLRISFKELRDAFPYQQDYMPDVRT